jgi:threonylcarbamoyladenosine tRNA methylthiotransferase MtaB
MSFLRIFKTLLFFWGFEREYGILLSNHSDGNEMVVSSKKYKVIAFGCRTNQYEAEAYGNQLQQLGWTRAHDHELAEVCIVNTCTVTASADSHSRHGIRDLARNNPNSQIWVTGCLAERESENLRQIPGVTAVVSNLEKEFLINYLLPDAENVPEFNIRHFEAHTRAFVKVQDGCNSFCSYCVIPYVRGRSRSRKIDEILHEVEGLIRSGYQEVVITGINVGDYDGGDGSSNLADLIKEVDSLPGLKRLRVSSIDPDEVDMQLQNAILKGKTTCPSMHIVLQSGSNFILKRMGRKYTKQMFLDTCQRLQAACPNFTFTTDIIVGFPGETEEDFNQTLEVMHKVKFAKVHMFPFSPRPQTKAERFQDRINHAVMAERKTRILHEAEKVAYELRQSYVGKTMSILTEQQSEEGFTEGHSDNFLRVRVEGLIKTNELIEVKIESNQSYGLQASLIKSLAQ